jgi:hypothetical protein
MKPTEKGLANLIPWQKGESGNPNGRPKGFKRLMEEALEDFQILGQPVPGGRTVKEHLVQVQLAIAAQGNIQATLATQVTVDGKPGEEADDERNSRRVVFEIIPNHREQPPEVEASGEHMMPESNEQIGEST